MTCHLCNISRLVAAVGLLVGLIALASNLKSSECGPTGYLTRSIPDEASIK